MLLHLTVTLPNQYWRTPSMTPVEIYTQLKEWSANRTTPYAWIHPLGDDNASGTTSLCNDSHIVGFLYRHFASGTFAALRWSDQRVTLEWDSPSPPPPPQGYTDDWNCSLIGICTDGKCICSTPWAGEECDQLVIAPSPPSDAAIYGVSPNVSSWGGNIVKWTDGKFHLFVSEIANGEWDTNSFVTHAVSDTVNGTYVKAATTAQHWAHNPQAIVVGSEMFLFHIGPANGNSTLVDCRPQPAVVTLPPRPLFDPQVAYILSATGPEGPWTEVAGGPLCDIPG
eukprot:m.394521 g.394521  ORF g.394521 m.394521 type:complete len:282 (-) comp16767_c0_seq9:1084-1929(-)